MAQPDKLRVTLIECDPPPMVQDYRAMAGGVRRYLGMKHDPTLGKSFTDPLTNITQNQGGWRTTGEVIELPMDEHAMEYVRLVHEGTLIPADAATAEYCGVKLLAPKAALRRTTPTMPSEKE